MNTPENPPAFPFVEPPDAGFNVSTGMTLRDYFAGQVLAGNYARMIEGLSKERGVRANEFHERIANAAYVMADEMLKRRTTNPAEP